ncbi:putative ABC transport system substrate-binding protein [Rhizobiales bacterium GAS113]|nr:putative ABC transport system substrate-binding protein [Rhizobiales bacterium GAS113]
MRRREFIKLVGGTVLVRPLAARAQQQGNEMRRLGVLAGNAANDPVWQPRVAALLQGLAALNWKEDRNLRIDWRYGGGDHARMARFAGELVALAPDVILAVSTPCVEELRRRTSTIPIVFAIITDPVGQGFVASLSRPGGNITGFTDFDTPMAGKWLGMLAQITPPVAHVAVLYNPATAPFAGLLLRAIEEAASSLAVRVRAAPVHDLAEIDLVMTTLSQEERGGLLVLPDVFTIVNRAFIIASAARTHLPAVYWNRSFAADGGLMSYGIDNADLLRRSAVYIDRILNGAKPSDLPVQNPTKFELVINLKTANAFGITVAPSLLNSADEVIE